MSILIDKISFNYENFNLGISLEIQNNEFHSILGPSGSGKTTLLRIIAGFIQSTSGKIIMDKKDITNLRISKREIGMVFQDYSLFPNMNVFNNISYGLKTRRMDNKTIKHRVNELLNIMNLNGFGDREIAELSGGEKQRVALARAIAPKPKLLLFDEPLSALDKNLRINLRKEIKNIQRNAGFAAIYVTHDHQEAMSLSDRLTIINNGEIMQTGKPENIYTKPANLFTAEFMGILNKKDDFYFRPEDCKISKKEKNESFMLTLTDKEYIGGKYCYEGSTRKKEKIKFYNKKELNIDDNIFLKIKKKIAINQL